MFGRKRQQRQDQVNERLAAAIDELERRQNNGMHATNAMIGGISRQVQSLSTETLAQLRAIATAAVPVPEPQAQPTGGPQPPVGAPLADGAQVKREIVDAMRDAALPSTRPATYDGSLRTTNGDPMFHDEGL